MKVSFDGFEAKALTFEAAQSVTAGQLVSVLEEGKVAPCSQGECFIGVALSSGDDFVTVQVKGVMKVNCDDENISVGLAPLAAGENNKVILSSGGINYWIIDKDTTAKTITVLV